MAGKRPEGILFPVHLIPALQLQPSVLGASSVCVWLMHQCFGFLSLCSSDKLLAGLNTGPSPGSSACPVAKRHSAPSNPWHWWLWQGASMSWLGGGNQPEFQRLLDPRVPFHSSGNQASTFLGLLCKAQPKG